jgi:copper chaperone CopZ
MKSFATIATAVALAAGCQTQHSPTSQESSTVASPVAFNTAGAPTISFSVPDMMCEFSCVEQVKEALSSQPGVKEVQVDFAAKRATVAVDPEQFDAEAAIATLVDYQFTNSQLIEDEPQQTVTAKAQLLSDGKTPANETKN